MASAVHSALSSTAPLWVIRPSTLEQLSVQLGRTKLLLTDDGKASDWRGLAELAGLAGGATYLKIEQAPDPVKELFSQWKMRPGATVGKLCLLLQHIDRWDVFDDNVEKMEEDVRLAEKTARLKGLNLAELLAVEVEKAEEALTLDDLASLARGAQLPTYDVFVLYGPAEESFVLKVLVPNLEAQGLRVIIKDRDLLGGSFEHAAVMQLIKDRCRKLIPVFSKDFFNSDMNSFLATFAQHCGLEERKRKLVPLVFQDERCDIPTNLSLYHKLPYNPTSHQHKWFWSKLVKSLHPQGAFNSNIKMLDMEVGGREISGSNVVQPSCPTSAQKDKESCSPTATPEKQPRKPPQSCPQMLKPTSVSTPQKTPKPKSTTLLSKISSPFSSKSSKSKKSSGETPFRDLCKEPVSPSIEEMEEEEGVNESGELLLPSVPTHEPGLIERVRGRVGGARRKYGSKQAESLA